MTMAERSLVLPAELVSVRTGRLFARDLVTEWGCEQLSDDVQLGASELLANAVRHAGTELVLTLRLGDDLVVEVEDCEPGGDLAVTMPDISSTSGRGLHIVSAIATQWGVTRYADSKSVWFRLALPNRGAADAQVFELDDRRNVTDEPARGAADGEAQGMQARAVS
jgi:anti-sigma regulatory factor (Ser/Thr protein kinase)